MPKVVEAIVEQNHRFERVVVSRQPKAPTVGEQPHCAHRRSSRLGGVGGVGLVVEQHQRYRQTFNIDGFEELVLVQQLDQLDQRAFQVGEVAQIGSIGKQNQGHWAVVAYEMVEKIGSLTKPGRVC